MKNTVVFYKQYLADALEQLAFNTLYTALHNCLSNFFIPRSHPHRALVLYRTLFSYIVKETANRRSPLYPTTLIFL